MAADGLVADRLARIRLACRLFNRLSARWNLSRIADGLADVVADSLARLVACVGYLDGLPTGRLRRLRFVDGLADLADRAGAIAFVGHFNGLPAGRLRTILETFVEINDPDLRLQDGRLVEDAAKVAETEADEQEGQVA